MREPSGPEVRGRTAATSRLAPIVATCPTADVLARASLVWGDRGHLYPRPLDRRRRGPSRAMDGQSNGAWRRVHRPLVRTAPGEVLPRWFMARWGGAHRRRRTCGGGHRQLGRSGARGGGQDVAGTTWCVPEGTAAGQCLVGRSRLSGLAPVPTTSPPSGRCAGSLPCGSARHLHLIGRGTQPLHGVPRNPDYDRGYRRDEVHAAPRARFGRFRCSDSAARTPPKCVPLGSSEATCWSRRPYDGGCVEGHRPPREPISRLPLRRGLDASVADFAFVAEGDARSNVFVRVCRA